MYSVTEIPCAVHLGETDMMNSRSDDIMRQSEVYEQPGFKFSTYFWIRGHSYSDRGLKKL